MIPLQDLRELPLVTVIRLIEKAYIVDGYSLDRARSQVMELLERPNGYIEGETFSDFVAKMSPLSSEVFFGNIPFFIRKGEDPNEMFREGLEYVYGIRSDEFVYNMLKTIDFWGAFVEDQSDLFSDIALVRNFGGLGRYADKIVTYIDEPIKSEILARMTRTELSLVAGFVDMDTLGKYIDINQLIESDMPLFSDSIKTMRTRDSPPYVCEDTPDYFLEAMENKQGILIYADDTLVALIKPGLGDSIMALRTIVSTNNTLPMIVGHYYWAEENIKDIMDNNILEGEDGWARVNVKNLPLYPITVSKMGMNPIMGIEKIAMLRDEFSESELPEPCLYVA